jgi:hypothetical protein
MVKAKINHGKATLNVPNSKAHAKNSNIAFEATAQG